MIRIINIGPLRAVDRELTYIENWKLSASGLTVKKKP